jgi:hypothetical protein
VGVKKEHVRSLVRNSTKEIVGQKKGVGEEQTQEDAQRFPSTVQKKMNNYSSNLKTRSSVGASAVLEHKREG